MSIADYDLPITIPKPTLDLLMKRREFLARSAAVLGTPAGLAAQSHTAEGSPGGVSRALKFLFMDSKDIHNTWGHLHFSAAKFRRIADSPRKWFPRFHRMMKFGKKIVCLVFRISNPKFFVAYFLLI